MKKVKKDYFVYDMDTPHHFVILDTTREDIHDRVTAYRIYRRRRNRIVFFEFKNAWSMNLSQEERDRFKHKQIIIKNPKPDPNTEP